MEAEDRVEVNRVDEVRPRTRKATLDEAQSRVASRIGWVTSPTDKITGQFLRYTCVGGVAYLVDISALFLLTELVGIHYLGSAAIGFLLGLVINYALSTIWVFNSKRLQNRSSEFSVFAIIGIGGLGLNELLIWIFTDLALMHFMLAKVASTVFTLLWNFSARKYFLFR